MGPAGGSDAMPAGCATPGVAPVPSAGSVASFAAILRRIGELDLGGVHARPGELAGEQVVAGDGDLLVLCVAVESDQLHPVEQRLGDHLRDVGRRDEEHVRQVELDLEVVVAERVVLRRVQHLEQRRCRVAAVVGAELVDLVEQDHRVHRLGLADGTDDPAGQRADIGAPVTADLRLIAYAAEGDPGELAAHRAGDRLAQRGLADSRRAGQRGIEHRAGARDVVGVVGARVPRHVQDGVQPGPDPARLWRCVRAALQFRRLAQRGLAHALRQVSVLDPGAVVVLLRSGGAVQGRQLLADRGELLAQQELALLLLHALADVVADGLGDVELGEVIAGPAHELLQPRRRVEGVQQLAALLDRQVARVASGVGQRRGVGDT